MTAWTMFRSRVNDSIVDIAGNPLIEVVDGDQTVDTVNPSTVGAPVVSDVLVTDAEATRH